MKNVCILLSLWGLGVACSNSSGNPATVGHSSPVVKDTVVRNVIPAKDLAYYNTRSKHFFDSLLKKRGFNGSYLVAKEGEIILEEYVGYVDPVQKTEPLNEHSAFHLASVSKTFTGMATLKLWEDGKLSLDDDLSVFFPAFPYKGITVKMLLCHRSGLANYTHYFEQYKWDKKKLVTNNDVLTSLYQMHPPLQSASGTHFAYCNTNYALLALIIEKASGMSYSGYLQKTFFTPLHMQDTYVFSAGNYETAMPSFEWNGRKHGIEFLDLVYGDKNIYSTVKDMLKWDQALYNGQLFKSETLEAAYSGYSFEKEGKRNYGLGWRMTLMNNHKKLIYHNGWWHGNNTVFIRMPDEKATIIVLGNKFNKAIYSAKKLCDMFGDYDASGGGSEE